jgi:hypothetical protein
MSEVTSERVQLAGNMQAAVAEAVNGVLRERGRGYASDREAWAELKEQLERTKAMHTATEKIHKEMWDAVTAHDEGAFQVLVQEFERSAASLTEEWAQTCALAKIAAMGVVEARDEAE